MEPQPRTPRTVYLCTSDSCDFVFDAPAALADEMEHDPDWSPDFCPNCDGRLRRCFPDRPCHASRRS